MSITSQTDRRHKEFHITQKYHSRISVIIYQALQSCYPELHIIKQPRVTYMKKSGPCYLLLTHILIHHMILNRELNEAIICTTLKHSLSQMKPIWSSPFPHLFARGSVEAPAWIMTTWCSFVESFYLLVLCS